jgi:hypothetical protein
LVTSRIADHRQRDRALAAQAAAVLIAQLVAWSVIFQGSSGARASGNIWNTAGLAGPQ